MVLDEGFEPLRLATTEPKSVASAYFANPACGRGSGTRTRDILSPKVCRNLQLELYRPLWLFPLLRQFLFDTLLTCLFQENLSSFGIYMGSDSVY